jgi:toxin ParE1/3/4
MAGRIMERCHRIGDAPMAGRDRDDLEPGLRTVA